MPEYTCICENAAGKYGLDVGNGDYGISYELNGINVMFNEKFVCNYIMQFFCEVHIN